MIFVPVSYRQKSYHKVETNPVYLVSTAECLRMHCYATVKISRRYCADYCPGDLASMVVSKYWSASSNARRSSTKHARPCSLLRPLRGFDCFKPFLLQVKQQRDSCGNHAGNHRSDRAVGESSSTSGGSLVNSASFVVTSPSRMASVTAAADFS